MLDERRDDVEDFLRVRHYSHGCARVFSPDRWCVTGDAGAFLDPLFSPGSDFIGISNSFITDLIVTDLGGEPVADRAEFSNDFYLRYFEAWLSHYQDLYPLFNNLLATTLMFGWYRMTYFGVSTLLFYEGKLCDPTFLAKVKDEMDRFIRLVPVVEQLIRDWHPLERASAGGVLIRPVEVAAMRQVMGDLIASREQGGARVRRREARRRPSPIVCGCSRRWRSCSSPRRGAVARSELPDDARVDPYAISLQPDRWEADGVFNGDGLTVAEARERTEGLTDALEALRAGRGAPVGGPPGGPPAAPAAGPPA